MASVSAVGGSGVAAATAGAPFFPAVGVAQRLKLSHGCDTLAVDVHPFGPPLWVLHALTKHALAANIAGPYICGVPRIQFIPPALAKLRSSPPAGEGWLFELTFDGWRVQLHKVGVSSTIYGRYAERTIMRGAPSPDLGPAVLLKA